MEEEKRREKRNKEHGRIKREGRKEGRRWVDVGRRENVH